MREANSGVQPSRIYFHNAGDNMTLTLYNLTLTSWKPITSVIAAKQTALIKKKISSSSELFTVWRSVVKKIKSRARIHALELIYFDSNTQ